MSGKRTSSFRSNPYPSEGMRSNLNGGPPKGGFVPRGFQRSASMFNTSSSKIMDVEERLEAAEKLALDLARRLREAEKRATAAEKDNEDMKVHLKGLREHVSRKHNIQFGEVEDDTDTYEGFLRMGLPDWWGVCKYGNGDVYEGEWKEGKPHGFGTCSFAHGNQYTGNWNMGGYHGGGKYKYANGDAFEGHWTDDKRHGFGIFTDGQTGDLYEEEYDRGQLKYHKLKSARTSSGRGGHGGGGSAGGSGGGGMGGGGGGNSGSSSARGSAAQQEAYRRATSYVSMERRASFNTHATAFAKFEDAPPAAISFANIPWPPKGDALLYDVTNVAKPVSERKKLLKDLLRRWHPDKWQGRAMEDGDRDKIMAKVTEIFQRIEQEKQKLDALDG